MDTGILHTHTLIVSLYLLQLLIRVILMASGKKETLEKYTQKMRIPHIVLSVLFLGTGIFLMVRHPLGTQPFILVKLGLVAASIPLGIIGSKRNSTALTGLALLLLVGAMALTYAKPSFLRSTGAATVDPNKAGSADPAVIAEGKLLYEKYCMMCHGADGAAGFQGAKDLGASVKTDEEIINLIKNGKGVMPPNTDLKDGEVEKVKEFVKYLRK